MNKEILRIALPSIAQNVTIPLLGLTDAAITGHLGGAEYVGAVAVGGMAFNMLYWLCAFLRMSTGGLTAQAVGRGDDTLPLLQRAMRIGLGIAFVLVLLQMPLEYATLRLMESPPEVARHAGSYFKILIWGAPAVLAVYALNGWHLGRQDARTPMAVAIAQNVVNISLSLFFVIFLGMKVEGVALGTLIAQWVGLAMFAAAKDSPLRTTSFWKTLFRRKPSSITHAHHAVSSHGSHLEVTLFLRTLCMVAVMVWFTRSGSAQGEVILAANALLMQFYMLFSYFMDAFAYAGEAIGGKYYGAKDGPSFRLLMRLLFTWGIGLAFLFTLIYGAGGKMMLSLLTDEAATRLAAQPYLPFASIVPLCGFATFLYDGLCIGTTKVKLLLASVLAGMTAYFTIILTQPSPDANVSLWLALLTFLVLRGIVQALAFRRGERITFSE